MYVFVQRSVYVYIHIYMYVSCGTIKGPLTSLYSLRLILEYNKRFVNIYLPNNVHIYRIVLYITYITCQYKSLGNCDNEIIYYRL